MKQLTEQQASPLQTRGILHAARSLSVLLTLAIANTSSFAADTTAPAGEGLARGEGRNLPPALLQQISNWPEAGKFKLTQLVRYSGRAGRIAVQFTLPDELKQQLAAEAEHNGGVRLTVDGSPFLWTLQSKTSDGPTAMQRARPDQGPFTELSSYDGKGVSPFPCVKLMLSAKATSILGQELLPGLGRGRTRFSLVQRDQSIVVSARIDPAAPVRAEVADLAAFENTNPESYRKFFVPLSRQLGMSHLLHTRPAIDVYHVFDQVQPDPAIQQKVNELLDLSNSPDFDERQRAAEQLRKLGRSAVLVMLRLDRDSLWPEQQTCVDALLRSDNWRGAPDSSAAKGDLAFLVDCLDDDDPAVREAARAAVSGRLQTPLKFEVDQSPEARAAAVDKLRDQIDASTELQQHVKDQGE